MKKLLFTFAVFAALFSAVTAQTAAPAPTEGLLYKISGKNLKQPSYIYGTIHIICQNDMFGMEKLNGYLNQTESVLMELDLDNPEELKSMMSDLNLPDGKTIKDFLTAEQYAKVDEMFKSVLGTSVENFKTYKPFMLSVMISTNPKSLGCTLPGSYDMSFAQTAAAAKKPVVGLETAAAQFAAVAQKPLKKQFEELYEMALDTQKFVNQTKQMIVVYKSQDSEKLYREIDGKLGDAAFQKVMLDDRNTAWMPKIEKAISEKSTFIAVGGAHLGGKNGVINLLKAKGYKVEAIKL